MLKDHIHRDAFGVEAVEIGLKLCADDGLFRNQISRAFVIAVALQTYAYALEVRCVVCDDPRCPFCVVTATLSAGAPHCRACARTEAS